MAKTREAFMSENAAAKQAAVDAAGRLQVLRSDIAQLRAAQDLQIEMYETEAAKLGLVSVEMNKRIPALATVPGTVVSAGPTENGLRVLVSSQDEKGNPQNHHFGGLRGIAVEDGQEIATDDLIGWY